MRHAVFLTAALTAAFLLAENVFGFRLAAALGFAAVTVIAAINAMTFLWLWWARTTPLALGMTCSWLGQSTLSIWWFFTMPPAAASWMEGSVLLFLLVSLYVVGGAFHIAVMQRSMELHRTVLALPILAVFGVAVVAATIL